MATIAGSKITPKLRSLTSLRFFAAAMVLSFHAGTILGIGDISAYAPLSQGVSFFFVLSGFILAHAYPSFPDRPSIISFYFARFARVWPLHIVTMLIWIAVIYRGSIETLLWKHGVERGLASVLLVQAWVPVERWATSLNGVSWSISAEAFFYAVFPLLILQFRKYWHIIFSVEILAVAAFIVMTKHVSRSDADVIDLSGMIYFSPAVRILEFTVGIAAREILRLVPLREASFSVAKWTVLEISALLVTFISMLLSKSGGVTHDLGAGANYYISATGAFPGFAILIMVFSFGSGLLSQWLSKRAMVFLGEISFALYLFHYMVVICFKQHPALMAYGWGSYAAVWAISLGGAAFLFLTVEEPARRMILSKVRSAQLRQKSELTREIVESRAL